MARPGRVRPGGLGGSTLAELREHTFICLPPGSGLRRLLDAACLQHGFTPRVDIEPSDPHHIPAYVAAGLGVGLVAASIAAAHRDPRLAVRALDHPPHPPIGLVTTRHPSPASLAFARVLGPHPLGPHPLGPHPPVR